MSYEDPARLLGRLRLGREEYCQRLLTMLILGGAYPRWNTRSTPSPSGVQFLRRLDELSYGESRCVAPIVFVDEFELPARSADERSGYPDYGLLWANRVWLVELKTERASHRPGQLPAYLQLAMHHYPACLVDLTYLTPSMTKSAPELAPGQRYAHVTWEQVVPIVGEVWGSDPDAGVARVRDGLLDTITQLEIRITTWRERVPAPVAAPVSETAALSEALVLARRTAQDGQQRAVHVGFQDLQAMEDFRVALRDRIAMDEGLAHVLPWLWNVASSGGSALTAEGAEHGYELRLSRYQKPVR
jgi:hypothetical protein